MRNKQTWFFLAIILSSLFGSLDTKAKEIHYLEKFERTPKPNSCWMLLCSNPPQILSIEVTNTSCGSTTGGITLNMSAGSYSYNWSPNLSTTNSMSGLVSGVYRVTITDNSVADCSIDTFIIVQNTDGPIASVASTVPTVCESANGQATLEPASYLYLWDDLVTSNTRINLSSRTYSVTATDPATNCYSVLTVNVGVSNPLVSTVATQEPATCNQSNGTASIAVTGGTGAYSYSWGTMSTNSSLPPGDYTIQVTDNGNGCVDSVTFTMINAQSVGTIELASVSPASCNGGSNGSAMFTTTEGFPFGEPSSIELKGMDGLPRTNGFLSAGVYSAYYLDAGGCIVDSVSVTMTENTSLNAVPNVIAQTCTEGGIISIDVTGGVPPYTYDWEDLPGTDDPKDRTNLVDGNYGLTVSDDLGCKFVLAAINVGNECGNGGCTNPVIITEVVVGQAGCDLFNGSAKVLINGDSNDYEWEWSPQVGVLIAPGNERQSLGLGTYSVTITDKLNNACFTSRTFAVTNSNGPQATVVSTSPVSCNSMNGEAELSPATLSYTWADGSHLAARNDLADGYHFVTVTDGACENIVGFYIQDTETLDATATINHEPTCGESNGSVTISIANGSGSYSYGWGSGATNNGLAAGNYDVYVADLQTGCDTVLSIILNDQIPGASVTISDSVFTTCAGSNDGFVDYSVDYYSGFAQPATIEIWDHADSVVTNGELFVGPHCIVVKDANGCIAGQNCFFVKSPLAINVFYTVSHESCIGPGSIELVVAGGEGGYTFDWGDLVGSDDPEDRAGIGAGTYSVTITDGLGCEVNQDQINVANICGCDAFAGTMTADSTDICDQKPNMLISATADGNGFVPSGYQVSYLVTKKADNIIYKMSTSPVISVAGSATFVIHAFVYNPLIFDVSTIEFGTTTLYEVNNQLIQGGGLICASLDVNGAEVLVNKCTVCNLPKPIASVEDGHCGVMDGSIQLQFSQDTTGFTYKWSPNVGNASSISNVEAGAYYVTVSEYGDATCSTSKTIVISNVDGPVVTIDSIAPTICTAANGFLRMSPPSLAYLWENGSESYVRSSLTDTVYAIRATDNTGCFSMLAVEIPKIDTMAATLEIISQPVCGLANGHAKVTVIGGSDHYSYSWGNFEEKQNLLPGNYTLVVVDMEYGCNEVLPFEMTNVAKNLIGADSLLLESGNCDQPYPICLDLPASNAFGYVYTDNGVDYSGNIVACGSDTTYYYSAGMLASGSYSVTAIFGGVTYSGIVTSQEEMLDSLKSWDPFSGWVLAGNRLEATSPHGVYEDLFLTNTNTGVIAFLSIQIDAVEQGVQLTFDLGAHDIFVKENATGCVDTLFAKIECITCPTIYVGGDTIFGGVCGVDTGFLCLDILPSEIAHYTIRDNWNPYEGEFSACANNQTQLPLSQGGHTLIVTNTDTYCVDTLQLYVYCVPPADFIVDTFLYEHDHVEICLDNSILPGIPIFSQELCQVLGKPKVSNTIEYSTFCVDIGGVALGRDTLCLKVCDNQGQCAVTYIYVDILPRMDTINSFVTLTTTDTFCIDTTLFTDGIVLVDNLCPGLSGSLVDPIILGTTGCVEITGMNIGVDTICLAVCDSYNHCDTTIVLATSDVPKPDTLDIELIIYGDTMICVDVSELPRPVESFNIICQDDPGKALFQVSASSYCMEINAYDYGTDSLCLAFCDDQFCDTLVVAVNIVQDSLAKPVANDDQKMVVLNRTTDLDVLDNDLINGTIDTMYILMKPQYGQVEINSDYSFTYIPDINTCEVQDSFIYVLNNKNGIDNAVVYLEVLCDEVTVYGALSPNGDAINDFLYIEGIDDYPNNKIYVYNIWGVEVFHREGYTNSDPWDGRWFDVNLPVGTYYYVISLGNGSKKKYSGYIQIGR